MNDHRELAERLYATRRFRDQLLGPKLFSDPAWDILLDLYRAGSSHRQVKTSSAGLSAVAPTTALRWLVTLEEQGLIRRRNDPSDLRRIYVELTSIGRSRVEAVIDYFASFSALETAKAQVPA